MSTQIPEMKWSEISIDFVTDLPLSANKRDTVLVTVCRAVAARGLSSLLVRSSPVALAAGRNRRRVCSW